MVPYERRIKLDEKTKCVMFGVSKESKAYRLYEPKTKKVIISRDVKFDEGKSWNWEKNDDTKIMWKGMLSDSDEENLNEPEPLEEGENEVIDGD